MNRGQTRRLRLVVRGAVQGVGFRPFVYGLASKFGLTGWVLNASQGVFIEVEGERPTLERFLLRLDEDKPSLSVIQSLEYWFLDATGYETFEIRESDDAGEKSVVIFPDIATCASCLREMSDPQDRRYRYPFINCTHCGPRFSIIESLPYDRPNTSMRKFSMCDACAAEYQEPSDRRFHAQPIACPECGPQLALWDGEGGILAARDDALLVAAEMIRAGRILALKGIGGFQLLVDARNDAAVQRLRERKHREEKPLAVMYPALEMVKEACGVSDLEARLLASPESPIVLLDRRAGPVAPSVAPGNPHLGVMLPYSPIHHLLLRELGFPVVATSGNLSDEPICIDEHEALDRLHGMADAFLVHDRPIVRHVDDSIARILLGREQVLRRARGYAPLPVHLSAPAPVVLAVGAHLKNAVALSVRTEVFVSQHIGDLETLQAHDAFRRVTADLQRLYDVQPEVVACDLHPDYLSTKYARELPIAREEVQHHYAHVVSCMADNDLDAPVLGVSWDGTGLGTDGTVWGGEFLLVNDTSFERVAHLRSFRLPGGEAAIKEPRRCALGVMYEIHGDAEDVFGQLLAKGVHAPVTTSMGRLFDAVASLLGVRQRVSFEGQAAMELEFAVSHGVEDVYPIDAGVVVDWQPMIQAMLEDNAPVGDKSAKFHNTLAEAVVQVAKCVGESKVVLTGGCFQNKYLTERVVRRLSEEGFRPYWHQRVPPNDGGIALGQVAAVARARRQAGRSTDSAPSSTVMAGT